MFSRPRFRLANPQLSARRSLDHSRRVFATFENVVRTPVVYSRQVHVWSSHVSCELRLCTHAKYRHGVHTPCVNSGHVLMTSIGRFCDQNDTPRPVEQVAISIDCRLKGTRRVFTASRGLLALLLVAILSQLFLAFVRRYFLPLTLASTWHGLLLHFRTCRNRRYRTARKLSSKCLGEYSDAGHNVGHGLGGNPRDIRQAPKEGDLPLAVPPGVLLDLGGNLLIVSR